MASTDGKGKYQPQVNEENPNTDGAINTGTNPNTVNTFNPINTVSNDEYDEDDPDQYMMLVRPSERFKKFPILQILFPSLVIIFGISALAKDEVSDGDWSFDDSSYWSDVMKEVDYDCGWKELRFTYDYESGYKSSETYSYSSVLCDEDEDVFDSDWCSNMKKLGKMWLGYNIMGILMAFASIPVVYFLGKSSAIYFVLILFSLIFFMIGAFNWLANEQCSDIEDYTSQTYTVQTNVGVSMILVMVCVGLLVLALLVSSIHLITKRKRKQRRQVMSPIQTTHVVT